MRQLPYLQMGLKVKCHTIKDTPDLNRDSQYEPVMIRTRDSVHAPQSSHACIVATLHVLTPASSPPKKSGVITFSYIQSSDTGWLLVRDTCALSDDIVRMPPVCNVPEWRWRVIINPWHWHGRVDCGLESAGMITIWDGDLNIFIWLLQSSPTLNRNWNR